MTRTAKRTLGALALASAFFIGSAVSASPESYYRPATPGTTAQLIHKGCIIRFDEKSATGKSVVPRLHANATHMNVGCTGVRADWSSATNGDLVVTNDGAGTIVDVQVPEDETLTRLGISCGPSGGGNTTRIRCYDRACAFVPAQSLRLYHPYANLWVHRTSWGV